MWSNLITKLFLFIVVALITYDVIVRFDGIHNIFIYGSDTPRGSILL